MMLNDILSRNWMPCTGIEEIEKSCPESVFFLEADFIRHYYPIAELPEDKMAYVISMAEKFNAAVESRQLCWYLYHKFTRINIREYREFPEFIHPYGYDTGIIYLLVLLSIIPEYEERARKEGFPMRYAHDAATRIGTFPTYFAQVFEGRFGIRARSLHFMLNFKDEPMYRIGRFDFVLEKGGLRFPRIYTDGTEVILLCDGNWRIDKTGERVMPGRAPQEGEWLTTYSDDGVTARGYLIDTSRGYAQKKEVELPRSRWRYAGGPESHVLHVHIPAGGKMLPELCRKSCEEALAFFAEKYPESPISVIYTVSWIANDAWLDYLPNSNMASLIRASALYPSPHTYNAGLYFVFGREDADYGTYPRNNSLEKAMLACIEDGRPLRSTGMVFLPLPAGR